MRILFFTSSATRTGSEVALHSLICHAARNGWEVGVICKTEGELLQELPPEVPVFVYGKHNLLLRAYVGVYRRLSAVLSDSGTVQEECCIFGVANVTIRDVTERPETIESGSNMLSGAEPEAVLRCVRAVLDGQSEWAPPPEYLVKNVSGTVARIVLGYRREGRG